MNYYQYINEDELNNLREMILKDIPEEIFFNRSEKEGLKE